MEELPKEQAAGTHIFAMSSENFSEERAVLGIAVSLERKLKFL